MSYVVEFTQGAEDDLMRLYDFLLDRAETLEELDVVDEAIEVIRQITPFGTPLIGKLLLIDALDMQFETIEYGRAD